MGIVGDWIVCISLLAGESRAMETLKLIKGWRRPPPPKQLVTGWSPAGSTEAHAGDGRCHRCLDCVWQAQLYRRTDKTHRNQWLLSSSSSVAVLVGWCCCDACWLAVKADVIVVSCWVWERGAGIHEAPAPQNVLFNLRGLSAPLNGIPTNSRLDGYMQQ